MKEKILHYIDILEAESNKWLKHKEIEDSPLGGNVVKAAHYGGTVAGLNIAIVILTEVMENRS